MSFNDILGQEKPVEMLKGYLAESQLSGAYLFTGPEGVGKKLLAKTLSKTVNCLELTSDSCDRCSSCRKIESGQHPDIHIIENGDDDIKIESIRQLQKEIYLRAYEAKVKVFIIDNCHKLTSEAQNALLKVLEEPPKNSLIILITDKPGLLYKTIISRCRTLRLEPISRGIAEDILKNNYKLDNQLSHFLSYFSEGRIGYALRLKDTDIFSQKNRVIDKFVLSRAANLESFSLQKKDEFKGFLNILATWFRDIYLLKTGVAHSELINFDRKNDLLKAMGSFTFLELNAILDTISDSFNYLEQNINSRLILHNLGAQTWKK